MVDPCSSENTPKANEIVNAWCEREFKTESLRTIFRKLNFAGIWNKSSRRAPTEALDDPPPISCFSQNWQPHLRLTDIFIKCEVFLRIWLKNVNFCPHLATGKTPNGSATTLCRGQDLIKSSFKYLHNVLSNPAKKQTNGTNGRGSSVEVIQQQNGWKFSERRQTVGCNGRAVEVTVSV